MTDPFATYDRAPALSFKNAPIGTSYTGEVLEEAKLVQARDFETGERATWPDGNPKMTVVLRLRVDGEERSLWAPKPSAMFKALADARKAAGKPIAPGGWLTVTFTGEEPNKKNPRLNPQKLYEAKYVEGAPPSEADPFEDEPPF